MAIDDRAFKLLALQQPVAIDLRVIVAAIKVNADLERIGDLAVNIAEASRRYLDYGTIADEEVIPRRPTSRRRCCSGRSTPRRGKWGSAQTVLERDGHPRHAARPSFRSGRHDARRPSSMRRRSS